MFLYMFGLLIAASATNAFDPLQDAKMVIVNSCKSKVGASEDDVQIVLKHESPKSEPGWCLVECLLTHGGMMKSGKMNKSGFLTSSKREKKYTDAETIQLEKMVAGCEKETSDANLNGCKTAEKIVECTTANGKDFDFKFPSRL